VVTYKSISELREPTALEPATTFKQDGSHNTSEIKGTLLKTYFLFGGSKILC
jgi:hypothetical protein